VGLQIDARKGEEVGGVSERVKEELGV